MKKRYIAIDIISENDVQELIGQLHRANKHNIYIKNLTWKQKPRVDYNLLIKNKIGKNIPEKSKVIFIMSNKGEKNGA